MTFKVEIGHVSDHKRSVERLPQKTEPEFSRREYEHPETEEIYGRYDANTLIVVGKGGSINGFRSLYYSLIDQAQVNVRIVTTNEPDYLNRLSREIDSSNTVVCAVSETGEDASTIEAFSYFVEDGCTPVAVTDKDSSLAEYTETNMGEVHETSSITQRFSGLMNSGLVPLALSGIDTEPVRDGAEKMYEKMKPDRKHNAALNMASALHSLDDRGYSEIALSFYSTRLYGFSTYISELMHQSVSKDQKGQTFLSANGPELHHNLGNRILRGRRNISPIIIHPENYERASSGKGAKASPRGPGEQIELSRTRLDESLESERAAFENSLDEENIPFSKIRLNEVTHESSGQIAAFFQYVAYYSALIRDVEPLTSTGTEQLRKRASLERKEE